MTKIAFDPRSGQLGSGQVVRRLEPKAAAVFAVLCDAGGALVSRRELLDRCWGEGEGSDEALTQAVAQIRRAFEELGEKAPIETLAKRGYRVTSGTLSNPSAGRDARPGWHRPVLIAALLILLLLAYFQPHWLRHFIRHNFGGGQGYGHQSRG